MEKTLLKGRDDNHRERKRYRGIRFRTYHDESTSCGPGDKCKIR